MNKLNSFQQGKLVERIITFTNKDNHSTMDWKQIKADGYSQVHLFK